VNISHNLNVIQNITSQNINVRNNLDAETITITKTSNPKLTIIENGYTTDNKKWVFNQFGGDLLIAPQNDAGSQINSIELQRTGTTTDLQQYRATNYTWNDAPNSLTEFMNLSTTGLQIKSDMTITTGSITSASGTISFGNEDLTTTGSLTIGTGFTLTEVGNDAVLSSTSGILRSNGGTINFSSDNVLTTGYVGIGTSQIPTNKLQVDGNTYLNGNVGIGSANPYTNLTIAGTSSAAVDFNPSSYTHFSTGSDVKGFFVFDNNVGGLPGYRFVIDSSGNVGIGNSSPYTLLDLGTSVSSQKLALYNSNWNTGGGAGFYGFGTGTSRMDFHANTAEGGTPQMVLNSSGNVGIGATNPGEKLEVNGAIRATNNATTNEPGLSMSYDPATGSSLFQSKGKDDTSTGYYEFKVMEGDGGNSSQVLTINSSGNVGIGVSSPSTKLDVYSAVRISTTASDYTNISGRVIRGTNGSNGSGVFYSSNTWLPTNKDGTLTDNGIDLGNGTYRMRTLYAGTGSINTSDKNIKDNIQNLNENELKVAIELNDMIKTFKFKDAIEEKGDKARIHTGFIAQDIENVFNKYNLDAKKYGLFCIDNIYKINGEKIDEKGNLYTEDSPNVEIEKVYGVRMSELLCFMNAGVNMLLDKAQQNISDLLMLIRQTQKDIIELNKKVEILEGN